ncbi:hypothetical protein HPP92_000525 [Vanilla planifolia]|uniref:Transcription repressor n=1 Tax=Vanilla planifolia TaxID=51239 RepID=A0A835VCP1_VANPL|nr:hypothetical protein HPP92_000525 [Vanilla planifolia]
MKGNKVRFKDRLARIFRYPAILRSSATISPTAASSTRSHSAVAEDIAHKPIFVPRRYASEKLDRHSCRSLIPGGCGVGPPAAAAPSAKGRVGDKKKDPLVRQNRDFYVTEEGDGASLSLPSPNSCHHLYYHCFRKDERWKKNNEKNRKKRRIRSKRCWLNICPSIDDDGSRFCGSDETEMFYSSRSFSSDSSDFYRRPSPKPKILKNKKKKSSEKKPKSISHRPPPHSRQSPRNGFQPLLSVPLSETEESHGVGFAVLKRTTDPYGDFRSSMIEMIMGRQIFGARELERLLHSYLLLNSPENHSAILRAFADVSRVLFSC